MQQTILLNTNENTREVEREEQGHFVHSVLTAFGVPIDDLWSPNKELDVNDHRKLRSLLASYGFEIVNDLDGGVKIYCEKELVAEFKKPHYVLKKDPRQVDPNKKLYLEMTTSTWSVLEKEQ